MDEYIGIIKIFAGTFAPSGWLDCNGSLLPISQYTALFSILGTTYGGNGTTNFALPDLRGRAPVGINSNNPATPNVELGQIGGVATTTLTVANIPPHTHVATFTGSPTLSVNSGDATISVPTAGSSIATPCVAGRPPVQTLGFNTSAPNVALNSTSIALTGATVTNALTGSGIPINTVPPYLGVRYIICIQGIYPSRP